MSETLVVVAPDPDVLASAVSARLVTRIIDAQALRGVAHIVLTGGRIAAKVLRSVKEMPATGAIDWSKVDLWWGDERFLPAGDPDRNETQARAELLDALPLDPAARVHAMPASDGPDGDDAEAAAERYARELAAAAYPGRPLPHFDVLMLGVGEDGHVASIFPGHAVYDDTGVTAAVFNSPKPPPTRITLTLPTIQSAEEVWLIAAGPDKTDAVGAAVGGAKLPAAAAIGTEKTIWLLDTAAAAKIDRG